jgi:hypothetical protein
MRAGDLGGDARLLGARHQVVDEHPDPPARGRGDRLQDCGEIVHALEQLDDDPFEPQVVTPDLLDQLGIVLALDQDPTRPGDRGRADRGRRLSPMPYASRAWAP